MKKFLFTLSIISLLFSCKKEDINNENQVKEERFTVTSEFVQFKDKESFNSVMIELQKLKTSELSEWESQHGITNSLRSIQNDTVKRMELEDLVVPDSRFATVINQNGLIAIGDSVYRMTQNYQYEAGIGNYSLLLNDQVENKDVKISKIVKWKNSQFEVKSFSGWQTQEIPFYHGSQYRLFKLMAWSNSTSVYSSNGVRGRSYIRSKNIWGQKYWKDSPIARIYLRGKANMCTPLDCYNAAESSDVDYNEYDEECLVWCGAMGGLTTYWMEAWYEFTINSTKYSYYRVW